jgi:voltage-gated potassium channel
MEFVRPTIAAVVLVVLSLWIQCAGMATLINWGLAYLAQKQRLSLVHSTVLIVRVTSLMIGLHLAQILVWAAFYRWMCLSAWGSAFYFSIANYSTLGPGDPVLPAPWRSLGPIEAVTGMLMCGLSVGLLFAVVTRLVDRAVRFSPNQGRAAESHTDSQPAQRGH